MPGSALTPPCAGMAGISWVSRWEGTDRARAALLAGCPQLGEASVLPVLLLAEPSPEQGSAPIPLTSANGEIPKELLLFSVSTQ